MELQKANKILGLSSGLGIGNILGLIFVIIGILLVLTIQNFNLPINLGNFEIILQYGAAAGSILGGLSMLFKSKEVTPNIKTK